MTTTVSKWTLERHSAADPSARMYTRTLICAGGCRRAAILTVRDDGCPARVMDRLRLLAASHRWVIDFDRRAWCPEHRDHAARH